MDNQPENGLPAGATVSVPVVEFKIGSVLSKTIGIFARNFIPFTLMAALFIAPLYVVHYFLFLDQINQPTPGFIWWEFALGAAEYLIAQLVTASLIYGSIQELRGTRSNIVECFRRGLPLVLPVIGVTILAALAIGIGFVLLIVPGFIVAIMLIVVVPVAVVERPGVVASLSRSREMTKGYRWKIFGLYLILLVFAMVVGIAITSVAGFSLIGLDAEELALGMTLANAVLAPVTTALYAVLIAVIYHDLRIAKEGGDTEEIAQVFE